MATSETVVPENWRVVVIRDEGGVPVEMGSVTATTRGAAYQAAEDRFGLRAVLARAGVPAVIMPFDQVVVTPAGVGQ